MECLSVVVQSAQLDGSMTIGALQLMVRVSWCCAAVEKELEGEKSPDLWSVVQVTIEVILLAKERRGRCDSRSSPSSLGVDWVGEEGDTTATAFASYLVSVEKL